MTRTSGPLHGTDLLVAIRDILVLNPERHDQAVWHTNLLPTGTYSPVTPVERAREFARVPVPSPLSRDLLTDPVCATTACVAGWAVILSAEEGTKIGYESVYSGDKNEYVATIRAYARHAMGLGTDAAAWMFSSDRSRDQLIAALDHLIKLKEAEEAEAQGG